jgi:hypothetical protein
MYVKRATLILESNTQASFGYYALRHLEDEGQRADVGVIREDGGSSLRRCAPGPRGCRGGRLRVHHHGYKHTHKYTQAHIQTLIYNNVQ